MTDTGPQFDERSPAEGENRHDELRDRFAAWDRDLTTHWSAWRAETELAYEFDAGRQWTPDEEAEIEDNGRIPVVFNLASPTVDAVSGAEIQNRQQAQYLPREEGDTKVNDVLTQGAEYVTDECNGDQEDSQAFRDCLVCGVGWTNTRPDATEEGVTLVRERIDPLEMMADPASKKACFEDARYLKREIPMSREEYEEFREEFAEDAPEVDEVADGDATGKRLTVVNPSTRYTSGTLGSSDDEAVTICEWQWWEKRPVYLTAIPSREDPNVTELVPLDEERHALARQIMPAIKSSRVMRKVYYRAYTAGGDVFGESELKVKSFTYKAMTGKRDRNKRVWFGLYRAMFDPQKFTNKLYGEVLHIIRTNAKGGKAMETDAVEDIQQFERSWAQADAITWLKPGALSGPNGAKMVDKVAPPVPPAIFQLMEWARDMIRACTGVNEEMLGMVSREQPGVLEYQRKQQAYGLLSPFFDAKRRYLRDSGKLTIASMAAYIPQDQLVRTVDNGVKKYVPMAMLAVTQRYDVIVDEAPSGPNQKARNMQVLLQMMPWLSEAGLDDEFWADAAQFTDFTSSFADKLSAAFRRKAKQGQDPEAAQIQKAAAVADIDNTNADTEKKKADAFKTATDAHVQHAELGAAFVAEPETPEIL